MSQYEFYCDEFILVDVSKLLYVHFISYTYILLVTEKAVNKRP